MDKTLHIISFYEIFIYGEPQEHFWVNFMDHLDSLHQWGMNLVLNPLEVGHFFYKLHILVSYLSTTISELFCVGVGVKRLFRSSLSVHSQNWVFCPYVKKSFALTIKAKCAILQEKKAMQFLDKRQWPKFQIFVQKLRGCFSF